ncbi:MAG: ATP-dependent DNA helicase [Eubacteriales bacterium]|nr:ATP-dependent DNA helicase [Eubacteriales bacterium]
MDNGYRLSVRDLVAFCFPPEDITPGGGVEDMLAGGQAHRARQGRQEGQTEIPIQHIYWLGAEELELFGRMDAFTQGEVPLVEEMKLSAWQGDAPLPEHWAQAVCYADMAAREWGAAEVRVQVSYLSIGGEVLRVFEQTLTAQELAIQVDRWLNAYLLFARRERAHQEARDASIRSLAFPYPSFRAGQRELAAQVYTAVSRKKRLFASLPTGTGKSAAVLYPALKALGEGKTTKLLYLTARNTARQSPLQALERMKAQGLRARVSVLTAKEKLCPHMTRCHPDDCPRAKGHYLRQEDAVEELLQDEALLWTDEVIMDAAQKHTLCPFELALRLTELSDVAMMDLNYAFDPFAQAKRLMNQRRKMTLLVDEAHHTVDRVRESLSGELDSAVLKPYRAAFGKQKGRKHPYYLALNRVIHELCALAAPTGDESRLTELPAALTESVTELMEQASALLAAPYGIDIGGVVEMLRLTLPFLYAAEHLAEDYGILLNAHGKDRGIALYCLLPGKEIARITKPMSGAVFFSGTLSPLPAMRQLLGGTEEDACFSLPSPFPSDNLAVVRGRVSTRYEDREISAQQVADCIVQAVRGKVGNYIAYFPSYAYLQLVLSHLSDGADLPELWIQRRDMTEEDREDFFTAFSAGTKPRLGLCVLGGLFSEGVDLPGECLIGVIVVGVGLPTPSQKLRAIQDCYGAHFGDGFGYACRIPAMQKVLQAGGRLIRSETDKGLLVLLDNRYYHREYASLLPPDWRLCGEDIAKAAKELWS